MALDAADAWGGRGAQVCACEVVGQLWDSLLVPALCQAVIAGDCTVWLLPSASNSQQQSTYTRCCERTLSFICANCCRRRCQCCCKTHPGNCQAVLEGGHACYVDRPAQFNRQLIDFVNTVTNPS